MSTKTLLDYVRPIYLFVATLQERLDRGEPLTPSALQAETKHLFYAVDAEIRSRPELAEPYQILRYGLVALVDELVYSSTWEGRVQWELLETAEYASAIGGDRVYELIENLTHADADLAEGFFYVLCLGFRGRYILDEEAYREYKERLYQMIPKPSGMSDFKITPDAYHVIPRKAQRLDPLFSLWRSLIIAMVILVSIWVFYQAAWTTTEKQTKKATNEIIEQVIDPQLREDLKRGSQ